MYVLGISCYYHDSSAALLKDGIIVAAAEEERFTRIKHDNSFPANAVRFCLESQGITINEIQHIGFYEKPLLKFERVLFMHLEMFPASLKTFVGSMPSWLNEKLRVTSMIKKKLGYQGDVLFIEHHLAHAASCFLVSPFKEAAILTIDGVGEWSTTAYGVGKGTDITLLRDLRFPHSMGLLYSTITAYLGFSVNNSEYKVMGLSAYGLMDKEKNIFYKRLRRVIDIKEDGSFCLDMSYFTFHYKDRMPSRKLCELLGEKSRDPDKEPITQRNKDIAAALQMVTEEVIYKMLNHIQKETKQENLVMAGGVALNSVCNGKILSKTSFKRVWIQPNASDGGTSMGVASYIYNSLLGNKRDYVLDNAYLGPGYTTEQVKEFLESNHIRYFAFKSEPELIRRTVDLISKDKVVGWFQGRMEWGPRALGSRSILSNACNPEMKEILNQKVKHREGFRPFAPVVCADDVEKYFECDRPLPEPTGFMLMVYPIKKMFRSKLASVAHVDGSGRLQAIRREHNPLYYDLIKGYGKASGMPILINTSFNVRGEPIVCTPYDAYRCMMGTGIDYLVIDRFLVKRDENPEDMWDSESHAKD
jgi:carbamoyltransferase